MVRNENIKKWNISCHTRKQGCHSPQWLQPSNMDWWALRKLRMWKYRILAWDGWGSYQGRAFKKTRLLHLPIHREALNFLANLIYLVSWINSNLLMFSTTCPLLQNSYLSYLLILPPWSSFSELSEALSPRLQSLFCPNKTNSQLSHCAHFFSTLALTSLKLFILFMPIYFCLSPLEWWPHLFTNPRTKKSSWHVKSTQCIWS